MLAVFAPSFVSVVLAQSLRTHTHTYTHFWRAFAACISRSNSLCALVGFLHAAHFVAFNFAQLGAAFYDLN